MELPREVMKRLYQLKALQSEKDVVSGAIKSRKQLCGGLLLAFFFFFRSTPFCLFVYLFVYEMHSDRSPEFGVFVSTFTCYLYFCC